MSPVKRLNKSRSLTQSASVLSTSVSWATTALFSPTDRRVLARHTRSKALAMVTKKDFYPDASSTCSLRSARSRISTCLPSDPQVVCLRQFPGAHLQGNRHFTTRLCSGTRESRRSNSKSSANMSKSIMRRFSIYLTRAARPSCKFARTKAKHSWRTQQRDMSRTTKKCLL